MKISRRVFNRASTVVTVLLAQYAFAKAAELWQEFGLQPSEYDSTVTRDFDSLRTEDSYLDQIRKSIASVAFPTDSGSAVLLDEQGTVVLCDHEVDSHRAELTFFPRQGVSCHATAIVRYNNPKQDFALATMNPFIIGEYGLRPIRFGPMGYDDINFGSRVTLAGYRDWRLQASVARILMLNAKLPVSFDGGENACKVLSQGASHPGMSGGCVFKDRLFRGLINAGASVYGAEIMTYFTPADVIRNAYVSFFPVRARIAGVSATREEMNDPRMPETCAFDRRQFLSYLM